MLFIFTIDSFAFCHATAIYYPNRRYSCTHRKRTHYSSFLSVYTLFVCINKNRTAQRQCESMSLYSAVKKLQTITAQTNAFAYSHCYTLCSWGVAHWQHYSWWQMHTHTIASHRWEWEPSLELRMRNTEEANNANKQHKKHFYCLICSLLSRCINVMVFVLLNGFFFIVNSFVKFYCRIAFAKRSQNGNVHHGELHVWL